MATKTIVVLLVGLALAFVHVTEAQQPKKVSHIGYLNDIGSAPAEAFVQGLRDLGYVEGRNVVIEFRTRRGKSGWSELADELVGLKVDVIVADGAGAVTAAKNASATTPIVMAQVNVMNIGEILIWEASKLLIPVVIGLVMLVRRRERLGLT